MVADNQLHPILGEMMLALEARFFYLAMMQAVAIPDICGAIEAKDGRASKVKYIAWYKTYISPYFKMLPAEYCYDIRCGIVHQAKTGTPQSDYFNHIKFFHSPAPFGHTNTTVVMVGDVFLINLRAFCHTVVGGVHDWFEKVKTDPVVSQNMNFVVRTREATTKERIFGDVIIG